MTKASAPGKIILFGEHAVVYDVMGIATAINRRSIVEISKGVEGIKLKDPWRDITIKKDYLEALTKKLENLIEEKNFPEIQKINAEDRNACQKFVIGHILKSADYKPFDLTVKTELRKGMGMSASVFSSTALALSDFFSLGLSKKKISELAYKGDVVAHGGTPSGIDNSTVTYGGYVSFRKSKGPKVLKLNKKIPVVIGDTGKPSSTGAMVSMVRGLRENNESVRKAIEGVEEISKSALRAVKNGNLEKLGELMNKNQDMLRAMRVSTPELEKLIKASLDAGAYGAKLSGAGGGGIMVALAKNRKKVAAAIQKAGGEPIITSVGVEGVKLVR